MTEYSTSFGIVTTSPEIEAERARMLAELEGRRDAQAVADRAEAERPMRAVAEMIVIAFGERLPAFLAATRTVSWARVRELLQQQIVVDAQRAREGAR